VLVSLLRFNMFAKLSTLALLVPYVAALTISGLNSATTGGTVTITWTASTTDPSSFSIELTNDAFHNTFAILSNVPTAQGSATIQLPQVPPGDAYTLQAVAINNINEVYSQSGSFSIGAATTSSASAVSTTSTSGATTSTPSGSLTTPSVTATTPASSGASSVGAASSSAASSTPSSFTSGAASFKLIGVAPAAALVLSAVAGAAMVF